MVLFSQNFKLFRLKVPIFQPQHSPPPPTAGNKNRGKKQHTTENEAKILQEISFWDIHKFMSFIRRLSPRKMLIFYMVSIYCQKE